VCITSHCTSQHTPLNWEGSLTMSLQASSLMIKELCHIKVGPNVPFRWRLSRSLPVNDMPALKEQTGEMERAQGGPQ